MDPKKGWARLLIRAGINNCTLHDLRRNLGSWMASQNVNVALIQSALNHKDLKTTINVYARTAKDAERKGERSRSLGDVRSSRGDPAISPTLKERTGVIDLRWTTN